MASGVFSILISTPYRPQTFRVVLDTGSSDFWLTGANCNGCNAPAFDTSKSSSFVPNSSSSEVNIQYGSGNVNGTEGSDTVSMANITNTNQVFGDYPLKFVFPPSLTYRLVSVNQIGNNVIDGDVAGLMGLAFTILATTGAVPYWLAIVNQLTEQVMAFWLARHVNDNVSDTDLSSGGVFTLGGTNETLFSGTLEFYDVKAPLAFWLLALASKYSVEQDVVCHSQPLSGLTVNGVPVTLSITNATCAIDTGTTLIGGPKSDVDALFKNIPQSRLSREAQGFYEIRM
jgi:cathepsin D